MTAIKEGILKLTKLIFSTITGTSSIEDNGSNLLFTTDRTAFVFNKVVRGLDPVNDTDFVTKQYIESETPVVEVNVNNANTTLYDVFPEGYLIEYAIIQNLTANEPDTPYFGNGDFANFVSPPLVEGANKKSFLMHNPAQDDTSYNGYFYYLFSNIIIITATGTDFIATSADWNGAVFNIKFYLKKL